MSTAIDLTDPRTAYPQPPFKNQQRIQLPGATAEMNPTPDHGEDSYQGSEKLKGLTAIVTGADSGIGRAIALAYAREGANLVISYLKESADAERTVELAEQAGSPILSFPGDLKQEAYCQSLVDEATNHFGRLDILVNNAALQDTRDHVEDFSTKLFDDIFKTNVYALFWTCRAALPVMSAGGCIINTASIQGYQPSGNLLPYAATKSAVLGMTKALAELAMQHGVRVNAVAPGPVWTPLIPSTMSEEKFQNFGANTLFQRPAQPAELAPLYVWLASAEASYVTGEVYGATGGRSPV